MNPPLHAEPDIVRRENFLVMGTVTSIARGAESLSGFEVAWMQFERRRSEIEPHSTDGRFYGVSVPSSRQDRFEYVAGMAVSPVGNVPRGLIVREVPAATYAVFECSVSGIGEMKRCIFGEWSSKSGQAIDHFAPAFEQYPPGANAESSVRIHIPLKPSTELKRAMFYPPPLVDDWSKWIVGEWEGIGESQAGRGGSVERIEFGLNGEFLISRGEAAAIQIDPEQADYLKSNMHASDEEIARFKHDGYASLQLFTTDQATGEVIGYLFDSLRCIATGRGKREGNREVMEWLWTNGHKSTRITERLGEDRMRVIQRTAMPDGSVMEETGESIRKTPSHLHI